MFDFTFWTSPCACCCPTPDDHGRRHVQTLAENDPIDRSFNHTHSDLIDRSNENGVLKHPKANRDIDRPLSSDHSDLRDISNENGGLKHPETDHKNDRSFRKDQSDLGGFNKNKSLMELREIAKEREFRIARKDDRRFIDENDSRFGVPSTFLRKGQKCSSEGQVVYTAPVDSPESKTLMLKSLVDMKRQLLESEGDKSSKEILKDFVKNATLEGYDNGIKQRLKKFNENVEGTVNWYFQEKLEKIKSQEFVTEVVEKVQDNLKVLNFFKEGSDDFTKGLTEVVEAMIAKHKRDQISSGVDVPEIGVREVD